MSTSNVQRRDFHKLTVAAFGGLLAAGGAAIAADDNEDKGAKKLSVDPALLLSGPNTCRGLNSCKGKGKGGENACAGQSACTTVTSHACAGKNDCKGQGGCGGYPGQNTCKSKGHCAVPLSKDAWGLARKQFEHLMKDAGKKVGKPPKAKKS